MDALRTFFKRHRLWVGFLAVILPLSAMLIMQYKWLSRLEKTSAYAHELYLENYLEAVATKIEFFYQSQAQRGLNVAAATLLAGEPERLAYHFRKRPIEGAREIFVCDFVNSEQSWDLYFYDFDRELMVERESPDHQDAIERACTPMRVLYTRERPLEEIKVTVDERRPPSRILFYPITDDDSRVIGIAGFVADENYFRQVLLPRVIDSMLQDFFADELDRVVVTVRDAYGRFAYKSAAVEDHPEEARLPLNFVFSDWELGIHSLYLTPEQWARANFIVNLTLSGVLALVLIGGVTLAFRTASSEMRLSQMKGEFVSNVSHELRTPLASIRVFGEFLRLGRVAEREKVQEYGEFIETESRRLTHLINNILDFSRIESGHKTYDFQHADLRQLVRDVLRTFDVRLQHAGFDVRFSSPATLPLVSVDREAIIQALGNLLDNAVKYSGTSRRIEVELGRRDRYVTLSVRDFGVGISRAEQNKVFDRFHRVSTGLVHDVKGSGLGLSIVNHVVQAHGGKVTVTSEPGKGSRFTLHLPVHRSMTAGEAADGDPGLELDPTTQG